MAFDHLSAERFISLATFRRSGERVATPVWFAHYDTGVVIGTFSNSGKVKRLHHTTEIEIAPCNFRGLVKGPYVSGSATLVEDATSASAALGAKYGWQWEMFARKIDTFIAVIPTED